MLFGVKSVHTYIHTYIHTYMQYKSVIFQKYNRNIKGTLYIS